MSQRNPRHENTPISTERPILASQSHLFWRNRLALVWVGTENGILLWSDWCSTWPPARTICVYWSALMRPSNPPISVFIPLQESCSFNGKKKKNEKKENWVGKCCIFFFFLHKNALRAHVQWQAVLRNTSASPKRKKKAEKSRESYTYV